MSDRDGTSLTSRLVITIVALLILASIWALFTILRGYADEVGFANQGELVADIDRWLAGGRTATEHLQLALREPGTLNWIDQVTTGVHYSYFVVPFLTGLLLAVFAFWKHSYSLLADYLVATAGVLGLGLVIYTLAPVTPPWMAPAANPGIDVVRVIDISLNGNVAAGLLLDASDNFVAASDATLPPSPEPARSIIGGIDPNPIAAMPSLHTAITALVAWVGWRVHRWLGIIGIVYTAMMCFSLVYLGEHYVVDLAAGLLLTSFVVFRVPRFLHVTTPAPYPMPR